MSRKGALAAASVAAAASAANKLCADLRLPLPRPQGLGTTGQLRGPVNWIGFLATSPNRIHRPWHATSIAG